MCSPGTPDRSRAYRAATAPSSMADRSFRDPPNAPKPVRTPDRKTTSVFPPWVFMKTAPFRENLQYNGWSSRHGAAPPKEIRRRADEDDPRSRERLHRSRYDGVRHDRARRQDEQRRSERIPRNTERAGRVGPAATQHEDAGGRERREQPAREHDVRQELLEAAPQGEQRRPGAADGDG